MALKDILTSGNYADDMVIALPDGTSSTVGEMRGLAAEERAALIQRQNALQTAEQGLWDRAQKLRQANLLDDNMNPVIPSQRQIEQHVASQGYDENDPLFGPLVKGIRAEFTEQVNGLKTQLQQQATVMQQAVRGYLGDNYTAQFQKEQAALPESIRGKVTLEQAVDFATKRRLTDEIGRLDIAAAVDRLTWEDRKAAQTAELTAKGAALEKDKTALAAMQRPGVHGPRVADTGFKTTDDKGHTLSLDDAIAAAATDDSIWASAAQFLN